MRRERYTMTKIEWTNETWNPITGCSKISEGCRNCYAERMHKRLCAMGQKKYQQPFDKVVFHTEELNRTHRAGNRQKHNVMIFVNSMSDTFHKDVKRGDIISILAHCELWNENNIFQILTKRAERLPEFNYPKNVWLGVTVEMPKYKSRIEYLKQTNAPVKFLSCEPLLEDLGELDLWGIDWVIAGGESGKDARPCNPNWVRNIQRQCKAQGVPFFFKQWGEYSPCVQETFLKVSNAVVFKHTSVGTSDNLMNNTVYKVGKSKAGCLLDGKEYKEFPKIMKGKQ